jgi:hypothetical protein
VKDDEESIEAINSKARLFNPGSYCSLWIKNPSPTGEFVNLYGLICHCNCMDSPTDWKTISFHQAVPPPIPQSRLENHIFPPVPPPIPQSQRRVQPHGIQVAGDQPLLSYHHFLHFGSHRFSETVKAMLFCLYLFAIFCLLLSTIVLCVLLTMVLGDPWLPCCCCCWCCCCRCHCLSCYVCIILAKYHHGDTVIVAILSDIHHGVTPYSGAPGPPFNFHSYQVLMCVEFVCLASY